MRTSAGSAVFALLFGIGIPAAAQGVRLAGEADHPSFGTSVAVADDLLVVGAPSRAAGAGTVYVFAFDPDGGWQRDTLLQATDPAPGDAFGHSVALDGERLLVGAPGDESASVYLRDPLRGWEREDLLESTDPRPDDGFGYDVALSGTFALVGAPAGDGAVHAYVYEGAGSWARRQTLESQDAGAFGTSVDLTGELAVVGAPLADEPRGADAGLVHLFARGGGTTWTLRAVLQAGNAARNNRFGQAVALSHEPLTDVPYLIAGGPGAAGSGNVYTFTEVDGVWEETDRFAPNDAEEGDSLGVSLAACGSLAVVGEPGRSNGAGSARVLTRDSEGTWSEAAHLVAAVEEIDARFGTSVTLASDHIVVGAPLEDGSEPDLGAAWAFEPSAVPAAPVETLPSPVKVEQYPNPFRASTTFAVSALGQAAPVYLSVYDALGRRVAALRGGTSPATLEWAASGLPSGVYLWVVRIGGAHRTGKLAIVR